MCVKQHPTHSKSFINVLTIIILQRHTLPHKPSKQHGKGLERATKQFSDERLPKTGSNVGLTSNRDKQVDIRHWLGELVRIKADADRTL